MFPDRYAQSNPREDLCLLERTARVMQISDAEKFLAEFQPMPPPRRSEFRKTHEKRAKAIRQVISFHESMSFTG